MDPAVRNDPKPRLSETIAGRHPEAYAPEPSRPNEEIQTKREIWNTAALVVGVITLGVGGPWLVHQLRSLPQGTLAARAEQRVVTLEVGGMTCGGCAATVQAKLAGLPGVATAAVRFRERRAYVVCEKGIADTSLTGVVARAGPGFMAAVVAK